MPVQKSHYEACLAQYSNHLSAIALLKQHRPYLEMIPSLRRPSESVITIPLPIVHLRQTKPIPNSSNTTTIQEATALPCDVAILMCDPEWKIKTGAEIFVFIHRPHEDFSDLLGRWRQTQVWLHKDYEWLMPPRYKHILSEGTSKIYPLFVVFPDTPERIKRGLNGANLPFVIQTPESMLEEEIIEVEELGTRD
ncbi:MAG: hypothetical protein VKL59_01930 [Nostocaceae cyanobacterium]|nr:hypothetical protein [Nostocaceae cyanobacterium]